MTFDIGIALILGVLLTGLSAQQTVQQTVSVSTSIGVINGKVENITFLDKTSILHRFLGIPFAEPPVGDLRFKKPVPKVPLAKPLDAFAHNNACMQEGQRSNVSYSEDCLYLNVYVPERQRTDEKLPVMVWIYGGGFTLGDSNMYLGDRLSVYGRVIVVTLNYRVSVFGFMSTQDSVSPGNFGLWDQQLAIKWIHENIAAFGGDTGNVTIFGQSAGSGSVIYQGLFTGNKDMFQRIIAESGNVIAWWASTDKGLHNAKLLGKTANCNTDSSDALVMCLRGIPADKLLDLVANSSRDENLPRFAFLPNIDNDFIKFDPKHVFHADDKISRDAANFFAGFDLLTGVNAGEGVGGLLEMFGVSDMMNFLPNKTDFDTRLVPLLVKVEYGDKAPPVLSKMIAFEYTNWTDPYNDSNIRTEYLQMHGDSSFNSGMYNTLDAHAKAVPTKRTYMYYFDIEPETLVSGKIPWFHKAMHGAELVFVFGYGISYKKPVLTPKPWEMELSKDIMTMWTNFAKTGNPNSPVDTKVNWLEYDTKDQHYLHVTKDLAPSSVRRRWNLEGANFWLNLVPAILRHKAC